MANYVGQISGMFKPYVELMDIIRQNSRHNTQATKLVKVGIQTDPSRIVVLHNMNSDEPIYNETFLIGSNGILQFNDVNIDSIVFQGAIDEDIYAIIDYLYSDGSFASDGYFSGGFDSLLAGGGGLNDSVMDHDDYFDTNID